MLPDCVQSLVAGVKPLLNYTEVDAINAADNRGTKVSTLMDYLQRRVHGRSYDAFNTFVKIIAGAQPQLFTSLAGRAPTQAEADFCMENYGKALKECIKSQGHSTDSALDQEIDLDIQHVQLTLVKDDDSLKPSESLPHDYQSHVHDIQARGESISAIEVLGTKEEQNKPQKVSLYGRAGIGKSTTMQWFARQWATAGWGSGFKILFLLQLRMLAVSDCQVTTIELLSMFGLFQVSDPGLVSLLASWLKCSVTKVIIFIDGLDEVAGFAKRLKNLRKITDLNQKAHPIDLCLNILRGDLLPGCTVVSTSRPFTGLSELRSDKTFEIMGFTEADIKQFVHHRHPSKAQEVMSVLRKSPLLMSVCGIGFYCALVSSLLADGVVFRDEDLQTYSRLIAFITVQYLSRKLSDCPFVIEVRSYFPKLAWLAFDGIFGTQLRGELSKVVFDEYDISQAQLTAQDFKVVQDVGLLQVRKVRTGLRHSIVAEFFHLSVQEMLAAAYLLTHPPDSENIIMKLFPGGQFNIALLYLFGLQYDTSSRWIKDIMFAVNPSRDFLSNVKVEAQIKKYLEGLFPVSRHFSSPRLKLCQLLYEARLEESAKHNVEYIVQNGKLQMLNTPMTIVDLMAIRFVSKYSVNMKEIDIHTCLITGTLVEYILSTFITDHVNTLTILKLGDNIIDPIGSEAIARWLVDNGTLQVLDMSSNGIGDDGAVALADMLIPNGSLRELYVSDNKIGVTGAEAFSAALHTNHNLRVLHVGENKLGDQGATAIAAALRKNNTLTTLNMGGNSIGKGGAFALATTLQQYNETITTLDVSNNNIGTVGNRYLTNVKQRNEQIKIVMDPY